MSRLAPPDPAQMTARQQEIHTAIASGPRGGVRGPLAQWLHRPDLADRAQMLGRYCRYDTLLAPRLSELAILVTARFWSAEFEWRIHKPIALAAGLDPATVDAIQNGAEPAFALEDEAAVYRFSSDLLSDRMVSDKVYSRTVAVLGEPAVVDLVGLLGYYGLISMSINVFEIDPPDGVRELTPGKM